MVVARTFHVTCVIFHNVAHQGWLHSKTTAKQNRKGQKKIEKSVAFSIKAEGVNEETTSDQGKTGVKQHRETITAFEPGGQRAGQAPNQHHHYHPELTLSPSWRRGISSRGRWSVKAHTHNSQVTEQVIDSSKDILKFHFWHVDVYLYPRITSLWLPHCQKYLSTSCLGIIDKLPANFLYQGNKTKTFLYSSFFKFSSTSVQ